MGTVLNVCKSSSTILQLLVSEYCMIYLSNRNCLLCFSDVDIFSVTEVSLCSRGDGQSYAGETSKTESGIVCQDWAAQNPHTHFEFDPSLLHRARRECRNPGGLGERPWCYTINSSVRWDYCDIPQCREFFQERGGREDGRKQEGGEREED